jgi:non-ribosomal peptide synthetase component F
MPSGSGSGCKARCSNLSWHTGSSYWPGPCPFCNCPRTGRARPSRPPEERAAPNSYPPPLVEALKALSQREGVTLYMTLLAAFQTLLARYTGQEDITVGSPIAGRTRAETEGLIGFFVNTLALRTDLSGNPSFRELLSRVREVALGAYMHQDLPFERLVEELQPERSLSHSPLFQVMLVLQNVPREMLQLSGLTLTPVVVDSSTAKFELTLSLAEEPSGLVALWEYNTDLFEAATIGRMAEHWRTLLEGIVSNPDQRLTALPLLTAGERQQLVVEWNNTSRHYPRDVCLHQLFEAQVDRSPEAKAVVLNSEHLT